MQTIIDFVKTHLLIVLAALVAAWFFLFRKPKRRRSSGRSRSRMRSAYSYARGRFGGRRGRRR